MKYSLGFPAPSVSDEKNVILFRLGIERQNLGNSTKGFVLCNRMTNDDCNLDPGYPFAGNIDRSIQNCLAMIFSADPPQQVIVTFSYSNKSVALDDLVPKEINQINLSPRSSGCALSLLSEIQDLSRGGEDYHIQISAKVEGKIPKALNNSQEICRKAIACLSDMNTALIMHGDDLEVLMKNPRFQEWLDSQTWKLEEICGTHSDFSTATAFEHALENGKKLFALPVDGKGQWLKDGKKTNESWSYALCDILHFEHRNYTRILDKQDEAKTRNGEIPQDSVLALLLEASRNSETLTQVLRENVASSSNHAANTSLLDVLPKENLGNLSYLGSILGKKQMYDLWSSKFDAPDACVANVIISGPTGCGKTLFSQALLIKALADSRIGLYVGPTRALVEEVYERLKRILPNYRIILSTGEASEDDFRFGNGDFDIACLVTEKANVVLPAYKSLLPSTGCVVIDEIHMLASKDRGGSLDMLMAKIREFQESDNGRGLQLVIASTELPAENLENISLYAFMKRVAPDNSKDIAPLVIASDARPEKVRHSLILYCSDEKKRIDYPLGDFASQNDRQQDNNWAKRHSNTLEKVIVNWPGSETLGNSKTKADNALLNHILKIASGHKRVIVVEATKVRIKHLAESICQKRERESRDTDAANAEAVEKLKQLLDNGELPGDLAIGNGELKGLGAKMVEWAKRGVYIHHADVPRKAREVIENVLRDNTKCEYTPIVFCTETLSYGVNLRADAIILLALRFPRSDGDFMFASAEDDWLTPTEYHNILGRVGRFAGDGNNEALVFINMNDTNPKPMGKINKILSWYCTGNTLKAATFNNDDIRRFNAGRIRDLDELTFSSFRTVMDALRMAQMEHNDNPVCAAQVRDMIDRSFFMADNKANNNDGITKAFEQTTHERSGGAFVDAVLKMSCERIFSGNLHLVSKIDGENGITEYSLGKGAALIDTGMHWLNVAPMARWLERLKAFCKSMPILPMEFFLPALLACGEVYGDFLRTSFVQLKRPVNLDQAQIERWRKKMQSNVGRQLNEIFKKIPELYGKGHGQEVINTFLSQIKEFAENEAGFKNSVGLLYSKNKQHYQPIRDILFLAMLAISLKWLNGEKQKMAECALHPAHEKIANEPPSIPARLFERMAWSAQMCGNFFPEPILALSDKSQLSRLVLRLRKGVPLEYLPLAQASSISASQILSLKRDAISCDYILLNRSYPNEIKYHQNLPHHDIVRKAILNFYQKEYNKLEKRVAPRFGEHIAEFMKKFLQLKKPGFGDKEFYEFAEACGCKNFSQIEFDEDTKTLVIGQPTKKWRVAIRHTDDPDEKSEAVCYLPWSPQDAIPGGRPVFTPGALFACCHFLERTRASLDSLFSKNNATFTISFTNVINWSEIDIGQDALAIMEPLENRRWDINHE